MIGSQILYDFFEPLAYNKDLAGTKFLSAMMAKHYPFYGVQFHPEKNSL